MQEASGDKYMLQGSLQYDMNCLLLASPPFTAPHPSVMTCVRVILPQNKSEPLVSALELQSPDQRLQLI